MIIKKTFIMV